MINLKQQDIKKSMLSKRGFTIVEILVVAPIVILVIGVFVGVIVSMTGDVLSTRSSNTLAFNIQDALNRIEQDIKLSGGFLATNNVTLVTPQGYNDDTTAFHNADATKGTMLILNSFTTTANPIGATPNIIYTSGQPNPCTSSLVSRNTPLMMNTVYFVKNGTLWRRVLANSTYNLVGCSVPWQQPSCSPSVLVAPAICVTDDIRLVDGIDAGGFNIDYFPNPTSVTANTIASDSSQSDANRLAALNNNNTAVITINATTTIAGRSKSQTGNIRAVSPNYNTMATPGVVAPTMYTQPQDKTALSTDTNITFTAAASGTNPTAQWQQSTDLGTTWSNISGATSSTLTVASVTNTMDGYQYRVIFTNSQGSVTSSPALLTVNLLSWTSLTMQNSWANYGNGYNTAAYRKTSDGMVTVRGLITRTGTPVANEVIGVLPVSYRPSGTLIFATTSAGAFGRVDVYANGEIRFIGGSASWYSLENIHFMPNTGRYTVNTIGTFLNGFTNYGGSFAPASYVIDNSSRVNLQGLVAPGSWPDNTKIFSMPSSSSPSGYMHIAEASGTFGAIGVDVAGSSINTKGIGSSWLSLNAAYHTAAYTNWNNLTLVNGWVTLAGFTTPQYTKSPDGLVSLKGLIQNGSTVANSIITTLPAGYRPAGRVLYTTVSALVLCRVDIDTDGSVYFNTGSNAWLSLDGITFYADQ